MARRVLGLCSGTSADGLDLALVEIEGRGAARGVRFLAGGVEPLPETLRAALLDPPPGLAALARLHGDLGRFQARAARCFLDRAGLGPPDLAGSHGQTVFHHDGDPEDGSLQIGDPAPLARALGCPVVSDFRAADLAEGGQGAPVSPFADWVLHRKTAPEAVILNLGGIANLTLLRGEEPPRAWDCGPANAPLDAAVRQSGLGPCDRDGALARRGRVRPEVLEWILADPFFQRPLPRSTGVERFGAPLVERLTESFPGLLLEDLLATCVEACARAVAASLDRAGGFRGPVFVCGGGARNPALLEALEAALGPQRPLRSYRELGWDPDLREAVAFALLADACWHGEAAAWPSTTGCRRPAVLGRISPAPPGGRHPEGGAGAG